MRKSLLLGLIALLVFVPLSHAQKTVVSIRGDQFYINDSPTYPGRYYEGKKVEGLLMNSRMVNGIFDDLNVENSVNYKYEDTGVWDADRNTSEFVAAMEEWYAHGLLAFTLNLQGGSPMGYGGNTCLNSAFEKNGALRSDYTARLKKVLDRADELGMAVILGYFYFGQDQYLENEAAVERAVKEATQWVLTEGYRNVIVEIANECDIYYEHAILNPEGIHNLINLVKSINVDGHRLLTSTSFSGCKLPSDNVIAASDFILLHGNGISEPEAMRQLIRNVRASESYRGQPIVVNEDDHYDFDKKESNLSAALDEYASWGYFDFRRNGEQYEEGYQSIPAHWGITTDRKKGFFGAIKEITGAGTDYTAYFENPILAGYHPDPSVIRVGEDYYMVNSTFEWFPAIPIYHSRDLVNWELINYGITNPEKSDLAEGLRCNGGIYAVTIRYNEGTFYIITTSVNGKGNFYITATDPTEEWSAPIYLNCPGIDPSLMWDDDGKCYYVGNGRLKDSQDWLNQQGVWVQELDLEKGELVGERVQLSFGHANNATWAEGPHIYKINGKYLLLLSEGGTEFAHAVTQFYSDNIFGPYTAHQINPVLTHRDMGAGAAITATGHADIVETQNGEWWMVALGVRYSNGHNYLARETFLAPMTFETFKEEEGIIVNPGIGQILELERCPDLPWSPVKQLAPRDDFNCSKLRIDWNMLRTPQEKWYELVGGKLTLNVRAGKPEELTNPSLLARRIDDTKFTATGKVNFKSKKANEEAGIILYRDNNSYISVVKRADKIVALTYVDGVKTVIGEVAAPAKDEVVVRMVSDGENVAMYCGADEYSLQKFGDTAPLWIISTRGAGKFNGTMVGVYATSNGEKSRSTASFDFFEYQKGSSR